MASIDDEDEYRATRRLNGVDGNDINVANIEVGEYVRINKDRRYIGIGKIVRISNIDGTIYVNTSINSLPIAYAREQITKHSKNIIDLIEVGDIIKLKNGEKYEVLNISWSKSKGKHIHVINPFRMEGGKDVFKEDIAEVLAKEQFKQISYKVEE